MQKALEKKLGCKFIRINMSKEGYNADYEASRVQTFISEFKNEKLKKIEESNQKNKRTRRRNKKTKTWIGKSNHPIKTECKLSKTFCQITKN